MEADEAAAQSSRRNGLEHAADFADLGRWNVAEDIPVKMHDTPLPARLQ